MSKILTGIGVAIVAILTFFMIIALQGLIYWGIGAFIIWAFKINFVFTFLQGVSIALIMCGLRNVFKITIKE